MNNILVIGSSSTDFVVTTTVKPKKGETVFGESFETAFGGKGANQAVAASRLGGSVKMIGAVGEDVFGQQIRENLAENGVDITNVEPVTHFPSGSAHITLHDQDNSIIVVAGANNAIDETKIKKIEKTIMLYDLVIIQNEIPQETNETIIELCHKNDVAVMYNPAPARMISEDWIRKVTYFTPNEHEFELLFPGKERNDILKKYPNQLIITLGSQGAVFFDGIQEVLVPAYKVDNPVDTTGAGDTFNGALAVGLLKGYSMREAIQFANLAAAISVQGFGAQGGMPSFEEVKEYQENEKTRNIK